MKRDEIEWLQPTHHPITRSPYTIPYHTLIHFHTHTFLSTYICTCHSLTVVMNSPSRPQTVRKHIKLWDDVMCGMPGLAPCSPRTLVNQVCIKELRAWENSPNSQTDTQLIQHLDGFQPILPLNKYFMNSSSRHISLHILLVSPNLWYRWSEEFFTLDRFRSIEASN